MKRPGCPAENAALIDRACEEQKRNSPVQTIEPLRLPVAQATDTAGARLAE